MLELLQTVDCCSFESVW